MAISRAAAAAVAGNTILAASWEAEFNNIINNALALVSPWTGNMDAGNFRLIDLNLGTVGDPSVRFEGDANTGIYSSAADTVNIATGGVLAAQFGASAIIAAAPEDARTATVDVAQIIRSTTSGIPAANIGIGLQFDAESADENPSVFGRIDFVATDVTAASEDTVMDILLRVAGAAEEIKYRFASTAGAGFQGTFTHAVTADRTWTLPDASFTFIGASTTDTLTNKTFGTGIGQGSGLKHQRNSALNVGGGGAVTVTWSSAFADASYTLGVALIHDGGLAPTGWWISAKSASAVTATIAGGDGTTDITLDAIGIHD